MSRGFQAVSVRREGKVYETRFTEAQGIQGPDGLVGIAGGQAEGAVARAEAGAADVAEIPCPLQCQRPGSGDEDPVPPSGAAGCRAAFAGELGFLSVRPVGVQPRGERSGRGLQGGLAEGALENLEIKPVDASSGQAPDVVWDFLRGLRRQQPPFRAPPPRPDASFASASASLASRNSCAMALKRWYPLICAATSSASPARMRTVFGQPSGER